MQNILQVLKLNHLYQLALTIQYRKSWLAKGKSHEELIGRLQVSLFDNLDYLRDKEAKEVTLVDISDLQIRSSLGRQSTLSKCMVIPGLFFFLFLFILYIF